MPLPKPCKYCGEKIYIRNRLQNYHHICRKLYNKERMDKIKKKRRREKRQADYLKNSVLKPINPISSKKNKI